MSTKAVAVLSDIHGNLWALQAVLKDMERRGVERAVNLGDSLYGPLDPAGTADALMRLRIPTVRGNEDRILIETSSDEAKSPSLAFVRDSLKVEHIQWLQELDATATAYEAFFLCHGTPARDDEYLLHEVREGSVVPRDLGEIEERVGFLDEPVVLCGHDHLAREMRLPDGKLVVNPGSVGLPAFRDVVPYPHVMESGTPHARYSIVLWDEGAWRVERRVVEYERGIAAEVAAKNGRPDWAEWLRTGVAVACRGFVAGADVGGD